MDSIDMRGFDARSERLGSAISKHYVASIELTCAPKGHCVGSADAKQAGRDVAHSAIIGLPGVSSRLGKGKSRLREAQTLRTLMAGFPFLTMVR